MRLGLIGQRTQHDFENFRLCVRHTLTVDDQRRGRSGCCSPMTRFHLQLQVGRASRVHEGGGPQHEGAVVELPSRVQRQGPRRNRWLKAIEVGTTDLHRADRRGDLVPALPPGAAGGGDDPDHILGAHVVAVLALQA
jgi:hypothetical protein